MFMMTSSSSSSSSAPQSNTPSKGVVYVLTHPSFSTYGENVYKLGMTIDLTERLKGYRTSFATLPQIVGEFSFANAREAERVLFWVLKEHRLHDNREFFSLPFERITRVVTHLQRLENEGWLSKVYQLVCFRLAPYELQIRLRHDEEAIQEYVNKWSLNEFTSHLTVDEFFDKFRFRPKRPEEYPHYVRHPELFSLRNLLRQCEACAGGDQIDEE